MCDNFKSMGLHGSYWVKANFTKLHYAICYKSYLKTRQDAADECELTIII